MDKEDKMKTKLNSGIIVICTIIVALIAGCSSSVGVSQAPDQPSNGSITVEGVTVSDTQITFHGKSTLPDETCINTELLADGIPLEWWPGDTCVDLSQGKWEFRVLLEGKALQAGTQYVLHAYQHDHPNNTANLAFDVGGPPPPSE
jgi:hypothetical protein